MAIFSAKLEYSICQIVCAIWNHKFSSFDLIYENVLESLKSIYASKFAVGSVA